MGRGMAPIILAGAVVAGSAGFAVSALKRKSAEVRRYRIRNKALENAKREYLQHRKDFCFATLSAIDEFVDFSSLPAFAAFHGALRGVAVGVCVANVTAAVQATEDNMGRHRLRPHAVELLSAFSASAAASAVREILPMVKNESFDSADVGSFEIVEAVLKAEKDMVYDEHPLVLAAKRLETESKNLDDSLRGTVLARSIATDLLTPQSFAAYAKIMEQLCTLCMDRLLRTKEGRMQGDLNNDVGDAVKEFVSTMFIEDGRVSSFGVVSLLLSEVSDVYRLRSSIMARRMEL